MELLPWRRWMVDGLVFFFFAFLLAIVVKLHSHFCPVKHSVHAIHLLFVRISQPLLHHVFRMCIVVSKRCMKEFWIKAIHRMNKIKWKWKWERRRTWITKIQLIAVSNFLILVLLLFHFARRINELTALAHTHKPVHSIHFLIGSKGLSHARIANDRRKELN